MSTKNVLFAKRFRKESSWLMKCPLLILKKCVIFIYRLYVSGRAGFVQVNFGFHTHCGGLGVFSLLKKC